ncbi:MAG: hypothetical protein HRT71_13080 [Flavobacteriales bacterium]|nr:hypothetical protein [Flavobacteriales bacterium]
MPKPYTCPTLFDNALQMNVSKLKQWGYLKPNQITNDATLNWSRNGEPIGNISINVDTHSEQPYIELDYKYKDEPRKYKVKLVSMPSNLGKGIVWYFLCPKTNKRCRKLYSIDGYFYHREAFTGCMYDTQTQSKDYRQLDKTLGAYFRSENLYSELYKKHFKKTYAGKPTKRYLRIMKEIQKGERISPYEIERLMLAEALNV